jgi:glutamate/aspartate transport system permease protein
MSAGNFDFGVIVRAWPFLLEGLGLSLLITVISMICGMLLGLLLALARLSKRSLVALVAATYVNGFRAIPLVLVIFWFYFLVPIIVGRPVGALASVLTAFILFESAYYSEIMRAGIQSVSRGQWQAGAASGLTPAGIFRFIILPQTLRNMVPLLVTQAVVLFQDTALVYVVSLRDLMTSASIVATRDNRLVEIYLFAALIYFVICTAGTMTAEWMQDRSKPV